MEYSLTQYLTIQGKNKESLNPYSNGILPDFVKTMDMCIKYAS